MFDQSSYIDQYQKDNIVRVVVKLNRKTDGDLIEELEKQSNRQGYIKQLIRDSIKGRA